MSLKALFKEIAVFFGEIFLFLTFLLPLLFTFYLILTYVSFYLFQDKTLLGKAIIASTNKEISNIILFFIGIIIIGNFIFKRLHKSEIKNRVNYDTEEIIFFMLISFLLAYYFSQSFVLLTKYGWNSILFLTALFFFLTSQIEEFYQRYNSLYFKNLFKIEIKTMISLFFFAKRFLFLLPSKLLKFLKKLKKIPSLFISLITNLLTNIKKKNYIDVITIFRELNKKFFQHIRSIIEFNWIKYLNILLSLFFKITVSIGFFIMLATITILITVIITFRINNYLDYNRKLRENLTISKIIPKSTTIGEKVVIEGYNFGWRFSEDDRLMSNFGPILVELWKDDEITFIVPLHWSMGKTDIWIERMKGSIPDAPIIKSKPAKINILNRWEFYPEQEELDRKNLFTYFSRGIKKLKRFLILKDSLIK